MKVNINLNGKTAELDIPDEKLVELGLMEKKKPTGYERVERDRTYNWVDSIGDVYSSHDTSTGIDLRRYNTGGYYSSEEVAKANARVDRLMRRLRRFAAENGGIPSAEDWKAGAEKDKWSVAFDYSVTDDGFYVMHSTIIRSPNVVYFNSGDACRKAIEEFRDELTWYFTEYQAMLY